MNSRFISMQTILDIATILGGISALVFFWDRFVPTFSQVIRRNSNKPRSKRQYKLFIIILGSIGGVISVVICIILYYYLLILSATGLVLWGITEIIGFFKYKRFNRIHQLSAPYLYKIQYISMLIFIIPSITIIVFGFIASVIENALMIIYRIFYGMPSYFFEIVVNYIIIAGAIIGLSVICGYTVHVIISNYYQK